MAHFAQIDDNNVVVQVIVVSNSTLGNVSFPESEPVGIDFCRSILGSNTNWRQTSYTGSFRGRYAGIGFIYDPTADEFLPPTA